MEDAKTEVVFYLKEDGTVPINGVLTDGT